MVVYRWLGKRISVLQVERGAAGFLQERGFQTASSAVGNARDIVGTLRNSEGRRTVKVTVSCEEDLVVAFVGGEGSELVEKFASLITFLGGGRLELKSLKEKEFYQRLENDFWKFIEEFLAKTSTG